MPNLLQPSFSEDIFSQVPGAFVWKDLDSTFLGANAEYAQLFGFKSKEEVIGKTDHDLQCKAAEHADRFRALDQTVLQSQKIIKALEIHKYADGIKVYLTTRQALKNPDNSLRGTICHGIELNNQLYAEIGTMLLRFNPIADRCSDKEGSYSIGGKYAEAFLSRRESEILFFLLRGKSAKAIACLLKISFRTVEKYVENLKIKFLCKNKADLISYAIETGFIYSIPNSLLSEFSNPLN